MSELKPCPFCGGDPYIYKIMHRYADTTHCVDRWKVMCGARVDCCVLLNDFATEQEALAAWNRRTTNESTNDR